MENNIVALEKNQKDKRKTITNKELKNIKHKNNVVKPHNEASGTFSVEVRCQQVHINEEYSKAIIALEKYTDDGYKIDLDSVVAKMSGNTTIKVVPLSIKKRETDARCIIELFLSNEEINGYVSKGGAKSYTVNISADAYNANGEKRSINTSCNASIYNTNLSPLDSYFEFSIWHDKGGWNDKLVFTCGLQSSSPYVIDSMYFTVDETGEVLDCTFLDKKFTEDDSILGCMKAFSIPYPKSIELPAPYSEDYVYIDVTVTANLRNTVTGETYTMTEYTSVYFDGVTELPDDEDFMDYEWEHISTFTRIPSATISSQVAVNDGIMYIFSDKGEIFRYNINTKSAMSRLYMPTNMEFPRGTQIVAWEEKLYLIGGGYFSDVRIYDIKNNTWSKGTPTPIEQGPSWSKAAVHEGKIYCFSGDSYESPYDVPFKMSIYDIENNSWETHETPYALTNYSAAIVGDNIYYRGGYDHNWDTTGQMCIYNITDKTFRLGKALPAYGEPVFSQGGVMNGKVVSFGGWGNDVYNAPTSYDIEKDEYFRLPEPEEDALWTCTACTWDNVAYLISEDTGRIYRLAHKDNKFNVVPDTDEFPHLDDNGNEVITKEYKKTSWQDGNIITANLLNKIEDQLELITDELLS